MRDYLIAGLFFGAGAVVTSLAVKYGSDSVLWDWILWSGVALMACSIATLALRWSSVSYGRPFLSPALLINLAICLLVFGLVWHFSPGGAEQKATRPLPVTLLPEGGQLRLYNNSQIDIELWGSRLADEAPSFDKNVRILAANHYYYFLTDKLEKAAQLIIGTDGDQLLPFEVYLLYSSNKLTAKFQLLVSMKEGKMTIHTQQLGLSSGWPS